jgi:PAS domain-containing protein
VPRKIFRASDGHLKVQSGYVERIMPLSAAEKAGAPPKSEQEERRRRMAAARRSALAAGLQGLYVRKVARERRLARRAAAHREANLAAATAPERIDDVLTRPSVRLATAEQVAVQLDPDRFIKADQARKKHAAKLAREAEARGDALAQLYVAAKDFIVDEAELEQRIETLFTADYHRHGGLNKGISIWDVHHAPISVNELRAELMGQSSEKILDRHKAPSTRTAERQKTVAEELTGGKLV